MEKRENLIFIKASIKRKKSHSDDIKYSGVRPIRRFYTGRALRQSCRWGVVGAAQRGGKKTRYSETDQLDFPIPTSHMVRS